MTNRDERAYIEACLDALRHPEQTTDMRAAAMALTQLGEAGVTALISLLADPTAGNEARRWTAIALGHTHNPRALAPLIAALRDEVELYLPFAAAMALGELGLEGAVPALVEALADTKELYGSTAMQALERIGRPSTPALLAALTNGPPRQRCWAARVLGTLGTPADLVLLDHLRAALRDRDPLVRWEAVDSLAAVAGARVLDDLRSSLGDSDADVRDAVITVLAIHSDHTDIPALENVRNHDIATNWESDHLSENAEWAIKRIRERA
jgi:HEAT repeat protein